ncbi:unnamed protein product [Lampetra planeri]
MYLSSCLCGPLVSLSADLNTNAARDALKRRAPLHTTGRAVSAQVRVARDCEIVKSRSQTSSGSGGSSWWQQRQQQQQPSPGI